MKKGLKRFLSAFLSAAMLVGSMTIAPVDAMAATIAGGGWYETMFAELTGVSDSDVTAVSWSGTETGSLTGDALTYLVRDVNGKVRIDIPGVKPGSYTLSVTAGGTTLKKENITVYEYDRSGYAHWNYTEGVGAYKDDGTLKPNAKVLYVTDGNKDTVSVTAGGVTVTGIGNILNSAGATAKEEGALTNTNSGIIQKLAQDGTPLVVRIIGDVKAPKGLTEYDSVNYGGTVGDNGYMARMQGGKDITIEGIGTDATIDGWGIHFICSTAGYAYGGGKSFEARNLAFRNVPEDCLGMEGQQTGSEISAPVERCWIHHCEFYKPTISNPAESDKAGGDGACDFKRGQYFTNSYCYYEGYHKTNLVGSSDDSLQFHLTYHHNHWKDCEARGPLGRQANIHMYNNFFENQTDYAMNTRANCYIFSEYNLFYQCKDAQLVKSGGGPIKSYNDVFTGCRGALDGTIVTDKKQVISNSNQYSDFDTNPSLSYIPSGKYKLDESIALAKATVLSQAGVMKAEPVMDPESVDTSVVAGDRQPTASVKLPYDQDINNKYLTSTKMTKDNIIFNVSKLSSSCANLGKNAEGQDIVFNVNTAVNISMTDGGSNTPIILMNSDGEQIISGTDTAYNLPAGTYIIQSGIFEKGQYKEAKITHLKITAFDPEAPTEAEPTTQATTQAKETTQTTTKAGSQEPESQTTTQAQGGGDVGGGDTDADNTLHNFTPDGLNDPEEFFDFEGNLSTSKGTVDYKGQTLTRCLKMESTTHIGFTSGAGKLILAIIDGTSIKIDDNKVPYTNMTNISTNVYEYPITAGTHTVAKGDGAANLFYIEYVSDTPEPVEPTVDTAELSVVSRTVSKGANVSVPVQISGITSLANYAVTLSYTPGALTYVSVQNGTACTADKIEANPSSGQVKVAGVNSANTMEDGYLFYVNFTANSTTDVNISVDELKSDETTDIKYTVKNGNVTVTTSAQSLRGDADRNGKVETADAIVVLDHISNIRHIEDSVALANADCDGKPGIDMGDVLWILSNLGSGGTVTPPEPPAPSGSFDWMPSGSDIANGSEIYSTGRVKITAAQDLKYDLDYSSKTDLPAKFGDISTSHYVKTDSQPTTLKGVTYRLAAQIEALDDVTVSFAICHNGGKTYAFINRSDGAQITTVKSSATEYKMFNMTLKKGDVIYLGGIGTNPEIYGINVTPKDGEVQEPSTEATTKEVATTKATTTTKETTTEATTKDQSGLTALPAGTYQYTDILSDTSHFKVSGNQSSKGEVKINANSDSYVELKLNNGAEVAITYKCGSSDTGKTAWVIFYGKSGDPVDHAGGEKTLTVSGVPAGVYKITAGQTGGTSANIISVKVTYGSVVDPEKPTEATTAKTENTTQPTTEKTELPPSGPEPQLSPVPSNVVATITKDDPAAVKSAVTTLNSSGGTLKINTPKITFTERIDLSGSKQAAIVGVQQSDGTYPVLDFSGLPSGKQGIQLKSASNKILQNIIVENAPDNGILLDSSSNNIIEHVIARYNGDTGIQSKNASSKNVVRYSYAYRNVDISTHGANADGFAPKLGASDTTFEYCYSWDNSDDGWDSYDKAGDLGAKVTYKHSAAWNNGNTKVFTGEYDYDNGAPLDKKLTTVKQMMESDPSFESNYNSKKFDTSKAKIGGESVSAWVKTAEGEMNGNGIKFGSGDTAKDPKVVRIADYCLAFDHKSKGFDNNNTEKCTGYITNCVSFNNNINYQLPYTFAAWSNNYGWGAKSSNQSKQNQTILTPSSTSDAEKKIYEVRDQIISYCYQNKFPDGISFDSVIDNLK